MENTADNLAISVKKKQEESFRKNIANFIAEENIMDFIIQCNENDIKVAVDWAKKENIFLVHKVFERVEKLNSISFLKQSNYFDRLDQEQRTWLHIAVIHDRNIEILKFLIDDKRFNIGSVDDYAYTPLHYYCQKEIYDKDVFKLLMKDQDHLTKQSKDGLTPLEFACSHKVNLNLIKSIPSVDMKYLIRTIDNISKGVFELEKYSLTTIFSAERLWLNFLQKNDKYMIYSYIKNDENFFDKYYLEPNDILSIIKKCPENGQGILSYIKSRFFKSTQEPQLHKILSDLTGIKIKQDKKKRTFYKSSLFLVLITGRFQLIYPLLRSCQFEIISYAMLICLVCQNFAKKKKFPDQVVADIFEIKDFCEDYAIAVMYTTYNKDLSENKNVIGNYINKRSEKLYDKSIVEIAYHANCEKYLSLPSCQESLTNVWTERNYQCPQIKFWLHSIMHLIFLALFAYVVVSNLFLKISAIECLCYIYGVGYLLEELRQIYLSVRNDFFDNYCVDAANVIDLCALAFMLIGFLMRVCLPITQYYGDGDYKLFLESKDNKLFGLRLILCLSLISFFMRVLYFASINQTFGPKLKMINTMIVQNLLPLIFIFIVFMTSFGITFQSLLYPNSFYAKENISGGNLTFYRKGLIDTFGDIFRRATFTIFDFHYTLNDVEDNKRHYITDANGRYAVYCLLIVFMVVVNVMLMNLLIALFSNTVTRIITESKLSWKSGRYGFIHEYLDRTIIPPPFNIIGIPIEILIKHSRHILTKKSTKINNDRDQEDIRLGLLKRDIEAPEEPSMSYYIYQAFAMSGQRYRLVKCLKDMEYEKEIHFKTIEEKIKRDKVDIKNLINEKCKSIEDKINSLSNPKKHSNACSTIFYT